MPSQTVKVLGESVTLLHVMNKEQNDWVSFLKELMEFVLSPSNYLIGIGPKLEGNTLHNKASS